MDLGCQATMDLDLDFPCHGFGHSFGPSLSFLSSSSSLLTGLCLQLQFLWFLVMGSMISLPSLTLGRLLCDGEKHFTQDHLPAVIFLDSLILRVFVRRKKWPFLWVREFGHFLNPSFHNIHREPVLDNFGG